MDMGCNSHLTIEYKRYKHDNSWACFALDVDESRDYLLYSFMANVRNYWEKEIKPVAEPRGIPSDASWQVKDFFERMGSDGHSHSWLSTKEFKEAIEKTLVERKDGGGVDNCYEIILWLMEKIETKYGKQNCRLVFCFDN